MFQLLDAEAAFKFVGVRGFENVPQRFGISTLLALKRFLQSARPAYVPVFES